MLHVEGLSNYPTTAAHEINKHHGKIKKIITRLYDSLGEIRSPVGGLFGSIVICTIAKLWEV